MDITKKIEALGIVPVVRIENADDAVPLCRALTAGGLPAAEITFRTDAAEESIRRAAEALPDMLIGAGTVLTAEQADRARAAGAAFIVTPGFNPKVVGHCIEKGYPVFPGCPTSSDIEQAIEMGLSVVKFFPAEAMGGLKTIKALAAPYGNMRFMPTGGVNESNLADYLAFDKVIACGGSWMIDAEAVKNGDFGRIEQLTRSAVQKMLGFRLRHIGINAAGGEEAEGIAAGFEKLFGWKAVSGAASVFAGTGIEVMKGSGRGRNGHIAVETASLPRARAYLEAMGFRFDDSSAVYSGKKLQTLYLADEIGGFALHLVQK